MTRGRPPRSARPVISGSRRGRESPSVGNHPGEPSSVGKRAGQQGVYSEFLGLTFRPGVPLLTVLAVEAAMWLDANPAIRSSRPPWDASGHLHKDKAVALLVPRPDSLAGAVSRPDRLVR
jgi:hypothetical protein